MNKTLLRNRKRWRIKQIDKLDEQKCTQKIGILPGPTKTCRIKRIDKLDNDDLDEFYCTSFLADIDSKHVILFIKSIHNQIHYTEKPVWVSSSV